ncbi:hypothetical protein F4801DRAFT_507299 [Xylaria longipes]|nr:hypothetical protein F4801DRAFT_507299 [Xylaria longipes]RYC60525.1 hypothetical protein CHU98_g5704 [Xylaria longipes]
MPRRIPTQCHIPLVLKPSVIGIPFCGRFTSTHSHSHPQTPSLEKDHDVTTSPTPSKPPQPQSQQKTMAQRDEELRQKMSGIAGDGGEAGVEYEDGKPVAMKRSVKNNMFRYI